MPRTLLTALLAVGCAGAALATDDLATGFTQPPASARPWVYWFPLSGNLTREGITADLEALQRVGVGGVLYMEVDQGAPVGPADFAGPLWRELFQHACREAHRLGLEINMNNDAGWCGSGGPWITPELSMQRVVWTETIVEGRTGGSDGSPGPVLTLPKPPATMDFYRDIAVLAMPAPAGKARLQNIQGKASFKPQHFPPQPAKFPSVPADACLAREHLVDLTAKLDADGKLAWDPPPGKWLILRFGHTTTGKDNHPAPVSGRGLECDKFSKAAAEVQFNGLMGRLIADNQALAGQGKVLISTHIDSWEVGSQNWTPQMRAEFQKRRGYDLWPFLPVFTGRVVDSLEVSERFLWDLRQTVSDLIVENYAGHFRRLAQRHGLRLSIEAYDGVPCDEMTYAGQADEPMSEFWSWGKFGAAYSCTEMASAAHTYGKRILGAEAFTATDGEKWQGHPANIKDLGDWAFCEGVNRFVFHRYALQPWANPNRAPGMSMGPWGLHYERTQTWWEQSTAWHAYLARCQYLLQQGLFVADICYLQPEGAPRRFVPPPTAMSGPYIRSGYNFDGCTPEVVLTRMQVQDGRIVLPDGMSYRVLVLPQVETMTPALLRKIKELVEAGATVIAPSRPEKSPSLAAFPECDAEVKKLASSVWGDERTPTELTERQLGQGRVIWGGELAAKQTPESDQQPELQVAKWIWRAEGNPAAAAPPGPRYFRRTVVLDADSRIQAARLVMTADNSFECWVNGQRVGAGDTFNRAYVMNVASALKPGPNLIAVTAINGTDQPNPAGLIGQLTIRLQAGRTLEVPTDASWEAAEKVTGPWTTTAASAEGWAAAMELGPLGMQPWGDVEVTPPAQEVFPDANAIARWLAKTGLPPDFQAGRALRYIHRRIGDADVYFVANGTEQSFETVCTFRVGGKQPELWHPETGRVAVLPAYSEKDGCTSVPLRFGPTESVFIVFRRAGKPSDQLISITRDGQELLHTAASEIVPDARKPNAGGGDEPVLDLARGEIWQPGKFVFQAADGQRREVAVASLPAPLTIGGPWEVSFDPKWGGPVQVTFENLADWSQRTEEGIKYYSGTAVYRKVFHLAPEFCRRPAPPAHQDAPRRSAAAKSQAVYLDLGKVAVMARVSLNGQDLGILWKPPYRVDVTDVVQAGDNTLEVRVVNLWINRQIGDEQLPEDSDRHANGTLKSWPEWIQKGQASPTGRFTFSSWRLWKKSDPLVESGLIGPVTVRAADTIPVP